jgi:uncharacterized protein with NRDE domain
VFAFWAGSGGGGEGRSLRPMCLLVVLHRVVPGAPLVVGANRDERRDRPARALATLRSGPPRVVGGLDELAGGSWLAVNERGVLVGLTNQVSGRPPDPQRRSRGELPLLGAAQPSAPAAVAELARRVRAQRYNPCWLLLADRRSLYAAGVGGSGPPRLLALAPGVVVLGNLPLGRPTAKTRRVQHQVHRLVGQPLEVVLRGLARILADHEPPEAVGPGEPRGARAACCVHDGDYATRSSHLVVVPEDPRQPPRVLVADGPPCQAPFEEARGCFGDGGRAGPVASGG